MPATDAGDSSTASFAEPVPSPPPLLDFPDDPAVAMLLDDLPEFGAAYLSLVETFDDDPGAPAVFTALADFVAGRLAAVERDRPVLERALTAVESVAAHDEGGSELVGYAFLDSLAPEDRRRIAPWLGPRSRAILEALDAGVG